MKKCIKIFKGWVGNGSNLTFDPSSGEKLKNLIKIFEIGRKNIWGVERGVTESILTQPKVEISKICLNTIKIFEIGEKNI